MEAENFTSLRQAADYANVSREAIRDWCYQYEIGEKIDENWVISKRGLDMVIAARNFLRRGARK